MAGAWANYDDVVQQLADHGLQVQSIEVGKLVRVATVEDKGNEKSGWYSLHELRAESGDRLLVGVFGNWREGFSSNGKPVSHNVTLKRRELSDHERAAIRQRIADAQREEQRKRDALARRAADKAGALWRSLQAVPTDSRYLARKQVGSHGLKVSGRGNLVIPMCDAAGDIHGLQIIYDDPATKKRKGRDKDFWPKGVAKRGTFYLIGTVHDVVLVAEGYATAASLHEATGLPVAVAWDAGNLMPAAKALKARYRHARILVCGDDDYLQRCKACGESTLVESATCEHCGEAHGKSNAGVSGASTAALAVSGAWCVPRFAQREREKLTDFNDLNVREGLHVVRSQIEQAIQQAEWSVENGGAKKTHGETGVAADGESWVFTPETLEGDFTLIYGTETCFDAQRRQIISLSALRAAAGKSQVRQWLESPRRQIVRPDQVVFDPVNGDRPGVRNLWGGWPTTPKEGNCEQIIELLEYLCSGEENSREVFDWLLCWLAYPIQHPGAKMQSAVLMHGPEGTGKNTFFGLVREIYADYGCIFSQTELESQFNGWASRQLFAIGNEVVTRAELYQQQGRIKNMITEPVWQINEKNLPTRMEANHCNFVFFSNRIDIAKLDAGDRRYCVIYTPPAKDDAFYTAVASEIREGGREALHAYLLNVDLGDFTPHTKPPMTRSKRELIDLGMDSTERFWRDFTQGDIGAPVTVCRSEDLYRLYQWWGRREGLPRPAQSNILLSSVKKKRGVTFDRAKILEGAKQKQVRVVYPPDVHPDPALTKTQWVTREVERFRNSVNDLVEGAKI